MPSHTGNKCKESSCARTIRPNSGEALGYCGTHARQFYRTNTTWPINSHRLPKICLIPGCDKKPSSRALCHKHYNSYMRGKIVEAGEDIRKCEYGECNRAHYAKGLCYTHYQAYKSINYTNKIQELIDNYEKRTI